MRSQHVLKQLKLRGSYGVTGNQAIGAYSTLGALTNTLYGWGTATGFSGYWANQFATPDLTWEKTSQVDVGVDLSLYGIDISFDWFRKRTTDLLFQNKFLAITQEVPIGSMRAN